MVACKILNFWSHKVVSLFVTTQMVRLWFELQPSQYLMPSRFESGLKIIEQCVNVQRCVSGVKIN